MGFDKLKVEIRAKPKLETSNPHRIEAVEDEGVIEIPKPQKGEEEGKGE